jgi:hypothetical protein
MKLQEVEQGNTQLRLPKAICAVKTAGVWEQIEVEQ